MLIPEHLFAALPQRRQGTREKPSRKDQSPPLSLPFSPGRGKRFGPSNIEKALEGLLSAMDYAAFFFVSSAGKVLLATDES
jgi:hypothetical protein